MPANRSTRGKHGVPKHDDTPPDLQTQLEALLDQVWRSEADWRLWDRIDALCAADTHRGGAAPKATFDPRTRRLS